MKTACTLSVRGEDIPGTMYHAITATTSLALRVIFTETLHYTPSDVALVTVFIPNLFDR